MRILQTGLGSMGKRRIRCLNRLGHTDIVGFDLREDRRKETEEIYGIRTTGNLDGLDLSEFSAMIVSTPPDRHDPYLRVAVNARLPVFVEASVVADKLPAINALAKRKKVLIAPSCTLRYHPAVKDITGIVKSREYGSVTNFTYQSGQYLPDWHPYEKVTDYYVSKRATGATREIVPFELTWLVDFMGLPRKIRCLKGRTMNVGAPIDDTYMIVMQFPGRAFGSLTVDVVCRSSTRSFILNMEHAQILWRWEENMVKLYDARNERWIHLRCPQGKAEAGYNKNIVEEMYIEELETFLNAVKGKKRFPNTLDDDITVLRVLEKAEKDARRA